MDEVENGEPEIRNFHEREHDKKKHAFYIRYCQSIQSSIEKKIFERGFKKLLAAKLDTLTNFFNFFKLFRKKCTQLLH